MRTRKTQDEISALKTALLTLIEPERPMTVRQVYYRAVSAGLLAKTEQAYKCLGRYLCDMRRAGELPYSWIADNTRWQRKPITYDSMEDALRATAKTYRQALWSDARCRVEVWLEKDALAGVLYDVTYQWDVPLMVTRGYPSLTYLQSAAEQIRECPWPTYLYYFGDHDPSGVDIPRKIESELRELSGKAPHFERVAVNSDQISRYNLQTRPTKKTDSRSKNFRGESVEVDAIPPSTLRQICEQCILQHMNPAELKRLKAVEAAERRSLQMLVRNGKSGMM